MWPRHGCRNTGAHDVGTVPPSAPASRGRHREASEPDRGPFIALAARARLLSRRPEDIEKVLQRGRPFGAPARSAR